MKKGESLELQVYKTLEDTLTNGRLGLNPEHCKLYHQKAYYSRARNNFIKVDVSIELFLADNHADPVIIWVWECKDYSGSIPVGEIEKFGAVLDQIGAAKTKGTVISSEGLFDRSAIEYATAQGIGLARITPSDKIIHRANFIGGDLMIGIFVLMPMLAYSLLDLMLSHFSERWRQRKQLKGYEENRKALSERDFESVEREFYGITSNKAGASSFDEFVQNELRKFSEWRQNGYHKTRPGMVPEGFSRERDSKNMIMCPICKKFRQFEIDFITNCVKCDICGTEMQSYISERILKDY